jgi:ATP-dependent helicase/nuclease subunit A
MGGEPAYFFHASSKETHADETLEFKDEADRAQKAEYWRKLYVAMTRAEDELYVTGALTKRGKLEGSWYEAIEQRLRPEAEIVTGTDGETALIYPAIRGDAAAPAATMPTRERETTLSLPELPRHRIRGIVRPSRAADAVNPERVLDTHAERLRDPRDPERARKQGIALHALLQHLVRIEPQDRETVAANALRALLPEDGDAHTELSSKARSILSRPTLSHLFGTGSRGEVPILAQGTRDGAPVTIAGRIDRLVVKPDEVLIVDYKSDAVAPADQAGVPEAYLTQMGLYALVASQLFHGRKVRAAILWTALESLMDLSPAALARRVESFTIG